MTIHDTNVSVEMVDAAGKTVAAVPQVDLITDHLKNYYKTYFESLSSPDVPFMPPVEIVPGIIGLYDDTAPAQASNDPIADKGTLVGWAPLQYDFDDPTNATVGSQKKINQSLVELPDGKLKQTFVIDFAPAQAIGTIRKLRLYGISASLIGGNGVDGYTNLVNRRPYLMSLPSHSVIPSTRSANMYDNTNTWHEITHSHSGRSNLRSRRVIGEYYYCAHDELEGKLRLRVGKLSSAKRNVGALDKGTDYVLVTLPFSYGSLATKSCIDVDADGTVWAMTIVGEIGKLTKYRKANNYAEETVGDFATGVYHVYGGHTSLAISVNSKRDEIAVTVPHNGYVPNLNWYIFKLSDFSVVSRVTVSLEKFHYYAAHTYVPYIYLFDDGTLLLDGMYVDERMTYVYSRMSPVAYLINRNMDNNKHQTTPFGDNTMGFQKGYGHTLDEQLAGISDNDNTLHWLNYDPIRKAFVTTDRSGRIGFCPTHYAGFECILAESTFEPIVKTNAVALRITVDVVRDTSTTVSNTFQ